MMATFHTMRTTSPYPAIRWMMMKTASSREPETSPQNPLMNSTVTKTRISMFTQGCFTFFSLGAQDQLTVMPPCLHWLNRMDSRPVSGYGVTFLRGNDDDEFSHAGAF